MARMTWEGVAAPEAGAYLGDVIVSYPRAVAQAGLVDLVVPLDHLAATITNSVKHPSSGAQRIVRRRSISRL